MQVIDDDASDGVCVDEGGEESTAAGIMVGEYITAVQGAPVNSKQELEQQLAKLTAGDTVIVEVGKDGKKNEMDITLAAEGVRMEDVQELRAACGVKGSIFNRPEQWKRFGASFLHPEQREVDSGKAILRTY